VTPVTLLFIMLWTPHWFDEPFRGSARQCDGVLVVPIGIPLETDVRRDVDVLLEIPVSAIHVIDD
jgi:hypothetical protein